MKKLAGPQNCHFIKGLKDRCFPVKFPKFLRNTFFYGAFAVAASNSFRFPACNLIKKDNSAMIFFSVNFAKFSETSFDRIPLDDCFLCLSVNFEKFFTTSVL